MKFQGKTLAQTFLGVMYQIVLDLSKFLYNKSKFLQNVEKLGKTLCKTCNYPDLRINYSHYNCFTKKKKHHKRYKPPIWKGWDKPFYPFPQKRFFEGNDLTENLIDVLFVTRKGISPKITHKRSKRNWWIKYLRLQILSLIILNFIFRK